MAKRTTTAAAPATPSSVHQAMTKGKLEKLLSKCTASATVIRDETSSMGGLISDAVENDHCHKGAFSWVRGLKKMDPAKRNEHLFHFHAYCDHLGWPEKELELTDREPVPAAASGSNGAEAAVTAEEDLRPRFLRTGSASAPAMDDADKPLH